MPLNFYVRSSNPPVPLSQATGLGANTLSLLIADD